MDISAALAAHLAVLTVQLEHPDRDLEAELRILAGDIKAAVASYTGMTMTIAVDSHAASFTVHDLPTIPPVTSLQIPLAAPTITEPASTLVLYAATPGAFVDLAADLSYALGIGASALILDGHLPPPDGHSGIAGLDTRFAIDQAVGVLISRGHTPESALNELHRLSSLDHGDLHEAAKVLLNSMDSEPTNTP